MSAYESIKQGLNEALALAGEHASHALVGQVEVQAADVAAIRAKTGLSQAAFARCIGVTKRTLLNWEHGRGRPAGPAQVLLTLIAKRPSLVGEILR